MFSDKKALSNPTVTEIEEGAVIQLILEDGSVVNIDAAVFAVGLSGISVDKASIGLGNVDNTSDANKPVSTATQEALNLKLNKADLQGELSSLGITPSGAAVTLDGPTTILPETEGTFTITNYDAYTVYDVQVAGGTLDDQTDGTLTITSGEAGDEELVITINGRVITVPFDLD